jgi:hypothetical protein
MGGLIAGDKLFEGLRKAAVVIGASLAKLVRYGFRDIASPSFRNVEADYSHRIAVLTFQQIDVTLSRSLSWTSLSRYALPPFLEAVKGK